MSNQPLAPEDVRAAAGAHHELGAPYSDAVIESFLERIDQKIDARLDARLEQQLGGSRATRPRWRWRQESPAERSTRHTLLGGAVIGAAATGVPLTLYVIDLSHAYQIFNGKAPLLLIWTGGGVVAVGVSRLASKLRHRSRS